MRRSYLLLALTAPLFISCMSTSPLYYWGNYEEASYQHYKQGTDEAKAKLMATYEKMISRQTGTRNTIAPGICAEYGYMLIQSGKREEGINYLKKEVELYPESRVFIERIIKRYEQ